MTVQGKLAAISCLQINLNHCKSAQDCVADKIKAFNNNEASFIVCVQEPYVFRSKHARKPKSCNTYCSENNPRTAIYSSKNLVTWFIESLSTNDITVIQMKIKSRETLIVSVYLDITLKEVIPENLVAVMKYAEKKGLLYSCALTPTVIVQALVQMITREVKSLMTS